MQAAPPNFGRFPCREWRLHHLKRYIILRVLHRCGIEASIGTMVWLVMNYDENLLFLAQDAGAASYAIDPDFLAQLPFWINAAENRIQRDLDLLSAILRIIAARSRRIGGFSHCPRH